MPKNREIYNFINREFTDINPLEVGRESCAPSHQFGPFVRSYYLLHYVVSGCGIFETARGSYTVTAGQVFIIRPDEVTCYRADDRQPWTYIWVGFTGACAAVFDEAADVITVSDPSMFLSLLDFVGRTDRQHEYTISKIAMILVTLFGKTPPKAMAPNDYARQMAECIERQYMQPLTIEEMASDIGLSRAHLSRLFKAAYGITPQAFLINTRLRHAEAFLREGYGVKQTAYLCGYADEFHFSKQFKEHYGKSPKNFL